MKPTLTALLIFAASQAHAVTNLVYAGLPRGVHQVTVLTNLAFITGYSEYYRAPLWACYRIDSVTNFTAPPRPGNFRIDKRTKARVKPSDYTNTGYDRGHMAPSYIIGLLYGEAAQRETFLMSNVIPQMPELNRGPWKKLEAMIANTLSRSLGQIWVVTGPVYDPCQTNRINGVRLPIASYKILLDTWARLNIEAYYIPQEAVIGLHSVVFGVSVDKIEAATGLDFFHELPDELEKRIEQGFRR